MRTALAVVTLLAGSLVGIAGTVAPAQAASCPTPSVPGYTVTDLHAQGMPCSEARSLTAHVVHGGSPAGYDCTRRSHAHRTAATCLRHGSHDYFVVIYHAA